MLMVGGQQFFEQNPISYPMNPISYSLGMLINKTGILRILKRRIEDRPQHLEKVTVWCVLWSEGVIGWDNSKYLSKKWSKITSKKLMLAILHMEVIYRM